MKKMRRVLATLCALCLFSSVALPVSSYFVGLANGEKRIKATEQDPEGLLRDDQLKVTLGESQPLPTIEDPEWAEIVNASKPLAVGETYVEEWNRSITKTRLKPYEIVSAPDEEPGAKFAYKTTSTSTSVVITTNGDVGGAFDYLKFAGMRYVEDALYTLTVDYTVLTANRLWKVGFEHNYFMDLEGGAVGETKQATGEFSASSAAGYNNNLNHSLLFMVYGGEESAQIQIDKLTITRLEDRPSVKNVKLTGTYAVGGALSVSYDTVVGEGVTLTNTEISWFITSDDDCTDMTVLNEFDNQASITIPFAANNKYIGCILKPYSNAQGNSSIGKNHIVLGKAIGETTAFSTFKFERSGDTFTETFDDLNGQHNVGIVADTDVDTFATGKNAISGKSLYIHNQTTEMKGGYFTGMKFTGGTPYSVSFKLKLMQKPTELYIQFRALSSLGYAGDVKYQVITPAMTDGNTYECYIPAIRLLDAGDYQLQIFSVGAGEYMIDDLKLTMLQSSGEMDALKTVGGKMTEDFDDKNMLTNIDTFGWGGVTFSKQFDGYGLVVESKTTGATTLYFNDLIGKLSAGGTYKVTFEYMVKSTALPQGLYVGFRSTEDGYQDNVFIDCTNKVKDQKYTFSHVFTLANKDDMFLQLFNMAGDGSKLVIDNVVIEKIA